MERLRLLGAAGGVVFAVVIVVAFAIARPRSLGTGVFLALLGWVFVLSCVLAVSLRREGSPAAARLD